MGNVRFDDVESVDSVQYADDVTVVVTIQQHAQHRINMKYLDAGLTLNKLKCKELAIRRSPYFTVPVDSVIKTVDSLRILGVTSTNKQ